MDAIFINAKNHFGPAFIKQFTENQADDVNVVMYIEEFQLYFEKPIKDMREFFEDDEIEKFIQDDSHVISFLTDERILQITGSDYLWWTAVVRNKKRRRLERLFGPIKEKESSKKDKPSASTYFCECGIRENEEVTDIETFEGSYKNLLSFVNKKYQLNCVKTLFKPNIVFRFNDNINWSTFDELVEKGVFVQ